MSKTKKPDPGKNDKGYAAPPPPKKPDGDTFGIQSAPPPKPKNPPKKEE